MTNSHTESNATAGDTVLFRARGVVTFGTSASGSGTLLGFEGDEAIIDVDGTHIRADAWLVAR